MYDFSGPFLVDPLQEEIVSYLFSILLSGGERCMCVLGGGVGGIITVKCEYSTYYSPLFGPNNEL